MYSIKITKISKTVSLYGQSDSPSNLTGLFSCTIGNYPIGDFEIFAGRVSKLGAPQRLLAVTCNINNWNAIEQAISKYAHGFPSKRPYLKFSNNNVSFEFQVERLSSQTTAFCDFGTTPRVRGLVQISCNGGTLCKIQAFEPDAGSNRYLYINGDDVMIYSIAKNVSSNSICRIEFE